VPKRGRDESEETNSHVARVKRKLQLHVLRVRSVGLDTDIEREGRLLKRGAVGMSNEVEARSGVGISKVGDKKVRGEEVGLGVGDPV
jgi:hypothetical protein